MRCYKVGDFFVCLDTEINFLIDSKSGFLRPWFAFTSERALQNKLALQIAHIGVAGWNSLVIVEKEKYKAEQLIDRFQSKW